MQEKIRIKKTEIQETEIQETGSAKVGNRKNGITKIGKRKFMIVAALFMACALLSVAVSPVTSSASDSALKKKYTRRYNKLKKKCKKKFTYNAPQVEMNRQSYEEYTLWDEELNYVYKDIYKRLDSKGKSKLKKSEIKWIKKKEKRAEDEAAENIGGSIYPLIYNGSLIQSTKARIRWLIRKYT